MTTVLWYDLSHWRLEDNPTARTTQVDDVYLSQPVGFVWHSKPRYRVKAVGRKI